MVNWSSFTKRITVNAAIEDIYKAWITAAGIEKWFLRVAEFQDAGKGMMNFGAAINMRGDGMDMRAGSILRATFSGPMAVIR